MKLLFFKSHLLQWLFFLGITVMYIPGVYGQKPVVEITVKIKKGTLRELLEQVEKQTDYSFIYNQELLPDKQFDLDHDHSSLWKVLDGILPGENISYTVKGKHILLRRTSTMSSGSGRSARFTVSGYVTDRASAESLIGVNIVETLHMLGTATNPYGYYSITLPEGETDLRFSYLGYKVVRSSFLLHKDTVMNVFLEENNVLNEVVILSDKKESGYLATHMGAMDIPMAQLKQSPGLMGEADVMKVLQMVPGVQAGVEGSAGLHVRGGGPDQNLVLLDGVPVYNVDHLLGFYSVFTPEAVKKVTLFKGSFPARFGGRLSSVIDVRTNDGDMYNYHGSFSVGLIASKINLEGPIAKGRTAFNFSARRTYIDLLARPLMSNTEKYGYYFYDTNLKLNHRFSDRSRLYLSLYHGKDKFSSDLKDEWSDFKDESSGNIMWGNKIASLRWNYIFNNKLFSNSTVAYNEFQSRIRSEEKVWMGYDSFYQSRLKYNSGIRDLSYHIDFDYNPVPQHHVKFGTGYLYHNFKPEKVTSWAKAEEYDVKQDTLIRVTPSRTIQAHEISLYVEDDIRITPDLKVNAGVHASLFSVQGKTYFSLQPRLSLRYQLTDRMALKGAYTQMNQYINLLTTTFISLPTDLWVPVTRNIRPMRARQYSLGGYYELAKGWEFSVEGYYKKMNNILEYKEGASFLGNSDGWEEKVEMGKGRSYGVEFMLMKSLGNTTGWMGYTLAKSDRKFAAGGINNGARFPYKYDRRHQVDLVLNHKFNERIDIVASWTYQSGAAFTVPTGNTVIIKPEDGDYFGWSSYNRIPWHSYPVTAEYSEKRNNYRLPATHYLNLGINFNKVCKHGIRTWNISIYNVYNSRIPNFVYTDNNYYNGEMKIKKVTILPFLPSVSYTYKF